MADFKTAIAGELVVEIFEDRKELGKRAARLAAEKINELLKEKEEIGIIFAAADSQHDFLVELVQLDIPWTRIHAFHMDEYIGLPADSDKTFGRFLGERIFDLVPFKQVHLLNSTPEDLSAECSRYGALLDQYKPDLVFFGIGENTHLAFNDPHVANFDDDAKVKVVHIDDRSRQQQVNEGCFDTIDEVPTMAFTLTIPALLAANFGYCMVPGIRKAEAVFHTFYSDISEAHPSTILRTLPTARLFLDRDSASRLGKVPT